MYGIFDHFPVFDQIPLPFQIVYLGMARKNGYFDTVFKDDPFNQFDDTTDDKTLQE